LQFGQGVWFVGGLCGEDCDRTAVAMRWGGAALGGQTCWLVHLHGRSIVGGLADAVAAYKQGAAVVGMTAASWEAEGGSVSMGVEEVTLVRLEVGGLMVVGGGPRKGKKLPSFLEGATFWGAMVEWKVQPKKLGVWCRSQERVVVVTCWKV